MLGIQDQEEPITAVDADVGLGVLNAMLHRLAGQTVINSHTSYTTQDAVVSLDLDGTNTATGDKIREPLAAMLAVEVAPEYDAPITPILMQRGNTGLSTILTYRLVTDKDHEKRGAEELAIMPSQRLWGRQ
jgi:hypothetical protein